MNLTQYKEHIEKRHYQYIVIDDPRNLPTRLKNKRTTPRRIVRLRVRDRMKDLFQRTISLRLEKI